MTQATQGSTKYTDPQGVVWVAARDYARANGLDVKAFARYVRKTEGVGAQIMGKWAVQEAAIIAMPTTRTRGTSTGQRMIVWIPVKGGAPDPEVMAFLASKGCKVRNPAAERAEAKRLAAVGAAAEADVAGLVEEDEDAE